MIYVLGLGNVLMGDDGFGPAVVREFESQYTVTGQVQIVDLGTPGLDLTPWLADADRVIIVDTIKNDQEPGTLRLYDKSELLRHRPAARVGPHDPGVKEALLTMEFAGLGPSEVALIGIVPARVGMSLDLSPVVQSMVPDAADLVAVTLRRFGASVVRRREPAPNAPWYHAARDFVH